MKQKRKSENYFKKNILKKRKRAKKRRFAANNKYCPYCNNTYKEMTDEHIIPQSIGGHHWCLIRVCKKCNSNVGSHIDILLSQHAPFRLMGTLTQKKLLHKDDRHESKVMLNQGGLLKGYSHFRKVDKQKFIPSFNPIEQE